MRAAQADGIELFEHAGQADKGVAVGNAIVSGKGRPSRLVERLGDDGVADAGPRAVDVDTQHATEEALADALRVEEGIVTFALVAVAEIEEAVIGEEHVAAVVPQMDVRLIDEEEFRTRVRDLAAVGYGETRQTIARPGDLTEPRNRHRPVAIAS